VARGESWLSPKVAAKVMKKALGKEEAEEEAIPLSERELEVLRLVAKGRTDRQIGETLCISTTTVRSHVQSILEKLECANRTEAAVRAVTRGILPAEVDK
jgi:DNA-binding NarL/FixJ family response regulator